MNNLSTSIATSREQSERLLAMKVKPETADMHYCEMPTIATLTDEVCNGINHDEIESILFSDRGRLSDVPAWSLSRIISMLPTSIPDLKKGNKPYHPELIRDESGYVLSIRRYTADCLVGVRIKDDPIECYVSIISWLIENNYFNKDYLK